MAPFRSFAAIGRSIESQISREVRTKAATLIVEEAMARIPRDTGEAASNLHVTAGEPATMAEYNHSGFVDPSPAYVQGQLAQLKAEERVYLTALGHAGQILGPGRRLASNGQMIGSLQYQGEYLADALAAGMARL